MLSYFAGVRKQEPALIPRDDLERALARLCAPPPTSNKTGTKTAISDEVFQRVADLLRHLEAHLRVKHWSSRPRTYVVLRSIGRTNLMPAFIAQGLKDHSFPYSFEKLPDILPDEYIKDKFIEAQRHVLTDATQLENGAEGIHAHTKNGDDLYYVVRHLGSGGYGSVDRVYSKLSLRQFARKRFMRKKNSRDDQILLKKFDEEISSLKRLHHQHLVSVIGSYTDQKSIAYLMEPIGECNLMTYLCQLRTFINDTLPSLRKFFGCLASAVAYLHRQQIRHRDLKPENVLVKSHEIYISDFGTALDWSSRGRDTTNDPSTPFTERYVAPEIAKRSSYSRNSAADVWSLGVVFLDMITVLRGLTIRALHNFLETHGTRHPCVWANAPATNEWFENIRQNGTGPDSDNEPLMWIKDMTQSSPNNRPLSGALANQVRNSSGRIQFIGACCATDDDLEDYPSPPSSPLPDGEDDLLIDDMPPELMSEFKASRQPFGSLVGSARSTSIEKWLGVDSVENPLLPDESSNPLDLFQEQTMGVPYEIIEDESMMSITTPDQDLSETQSVVSNTYKTLHERAGYDIIQDDSDGDEECAGLGGLVYEILEDSSASEASTVRQQRPETDGTSSNLLSASDPADGLLQGAKSVSAETVRIIEAQLNALPEEPIENGASTSLGHAKAQPSIHVQTKSLTKAAETPEKQDLDVGNKKKPAKSKVSFFLEDDQRKHEDIAATPTKETKANPKSSGSLYDALETKSAVRSLNATNLARLQESAPKDSQFSQGTAKAKVSGFILDEAQISPSIYMQEVWQAASSAATSIISEGTKKAFGKLGSGLAWQDRTANFLEKYAKAGKAAAVRELLKAGCNPGTIEKPRIRPLMLAVKGRSQRHNKCVAALLASGADVNARERSGRTALHYAIEHQDFHGYTNLIRDLLEAGADPNNRDKSGDFPLLQILYGGYKPLAKHKRDALACLLQTEFATDVNVMPPGTLNMPLHLAIRRKDPWAVSMLVLRGAKVNEPNGSGMTPLMLAADGWRLKVTSGQMQILRALLDGGVNVNEQDTSGNTALHIACSALCEKAVKLLLSKGADPQIMDYGEPHRPYHYAKNSPELIKKAPEAHAAIMQALFGSMGFDSQSIVQGECAVVTAIRKYNLEETKYFVGHGAKLDYLYESVKKRPLLHIALRGGKDRLSRFMIDNGASLSLQDQDGHDAFSICALMEQDKFTKNIVDYMTKKGQAKVKKSNDEEKRSGTEKPNDVEKEANAEMQNSTDTQNTAKNKNSTEQPGIRKSPDATRKHNSPKQQNTTKTSSTVDTPSSMKELRFVLCREDKPNVAAVDINGFRKPES